VEDSNVRKRAGRLYQPVSPRQGVESRAVTAVPSTGGALCQVRSILCVLCWLSVQKWKGIGADGCELISLSCVTVSRPPGCVELKLSSRSSAGHEIEVDHTQSRDSGDC
jgi:hypothetical protein